MQFRMVRCITMLLLCVLLSSYNCAPNKSKTLPRAQGLQKASYSVFPEKMDYPVAFELGDVILSMGTQDAPPAPIPGRLLVKIAPSEIANPFQPAKHKFSWDWKPFVKKGILPSSIKIARTEYTGLTRRGNPTFRIHLEKPQHRKVLARVFSTTRAVLLKDTLRPSKEASLSSILVEIDRRDTAEQSPPRSSEQFYHLHEGSSLIHTFKSLGVQSMQRIFHIVEQEDKDRPGIFHVRKIKDLLATAKEENPLRTARAYPNAQTAGNMENWFQLKLDQKTNLDAAIKILKTYHGIQKISADYPVLSTAVPNDSNFSDQWGLQNSGQSGGLPGFDINIETAWDDPAPIERHIIVAVIDTGFKEDLDELANRLWINPGEPLPADGIDNDGNRYVDDIHGITAYDPWKVILNDPSPGGPSMPLDPHATKVAGVIAAETNNNNALSGVAGTADVQLMNIAIGWCSIEATFDSGSAELSEGLLYAILHQADIANMSVSTPGMPYLFYETVEAALDSGVILIASAGNDGQSFTKHLGVNNFEVYPAAMRGVISVGGVDRHGRRWSSSNYGPGLDLVAPAHEITTITFIAPGQTVSDVVHNVSGTSMSAAFVSGGAAVVLGKYPAITAPYMRSWLKATAQDILDPENTGAILVGQDSWTGSGMLDVGTATTALVNIQDQPIAVDLLIERLNLRGTVKHFSNHVPDAVAGNPDLGITVTVPDYCIEPDGTNLCLKNWRLEYGIGDSPQVWFPIIISDSSVTTSVIDVERTGSSYYRSTEIASGHNYLNTDLLDNFTLYTIRLTAENYSNREFIEKDWVVPMRAKLFVPHRNTSIVGRWGWDTVYGFVDIRDNANYQISFEQDDGTLLWTSSPFYPATRYDDTYWDGRPIRDDWQASATAFTKLLGMRSGLEYRENETIPGYNPIYPFGTHPQNYTEGWYKYTLSVQSPSGSVETESLRVYLDNSSFASENNWPLDVMTHPNQHFQNWAEMLVTDVGSSFGRRLFMHIDKKFLCIGSGGSVIWEKDIFNFPEFYSAFPGFVVEDLDGDNVKEIVVAGMDNRWIDDKYVIVFEVYVLNQDGSIYNPEAPAPAKWPITMVYDDSPFFFGFVSKLHVADIAGDTNKEIIFYQPPLKYYSIPEDDILPGYLHVVDLNAQPISNAWPREYPPEQEGMLIDTGDIDADGKDEILLQPATILEGDGSVNSSWALEDTLPTINYRTKSFFVQMDTDPQLEVLQYSTYSNTAGFDYTVTLRDHDNTDMDAANSWPVELASGLIPDPTEPYSLPCGIYATTAQVIPGGYPEIILGYEKVTVLDRNGQQVASIPTIDLDGYCAGVEFLDVDNDGTGEIVALVHRLKRNAPAYSRRGSFVEAYELDGTRLADNDYRWPLNARSVKTESTRGQYILLDDGMNWNGTITIRDIDGDGTLEVIHIKNLIYRNEPVTNDMRIEVLNLQ